MIDMLPYKVTYVNNCRDSLLNSYMWRVKYMPVEIETKTATEDIGLPLRRFTKTSRIGHQIH